MFLQKAASQHPRLRYHQKRHHQRDVVNRTLSTDARSGRMVSSCHWQVLQRMGCAEFGRIRRDACPTPSQWRVHGMLKLGISFPEAT